MNNTAFKKRTRGKKQANKMMADSGKQDIISEEDSKSQKQTMDFKKGIRWKIQTEKVIAVFTFVCSTVVLQLVGKIQRRTEGCSSAMIDLYGKHGVQRVSEINCLLIPHQ